MRAFANTKRYYSLTTIPAGNNGSVIVVRHAFSSSCLPHCHILRPSIGSIMGRSSSATMRVRTLKESLSEESLEFLRKTSGDIVRILEQHPNQFRVDH